MYQCPHSCMPVSLGVASDLWTWSPGEVHVSQDKAGLEECHPQGSSDFSNISHVYPKTDFV